MSPELYLAKEEKKRHILEKRKATSRAKYGVDFPSQAKIVKDKRKKTCLTRYGYEHASQNQEIKDKAKVTCLNKYGVEYPTQVYHLYDPKTKEEKIRSLNEKRTATNRKRYGADHLRQSDKFRKEHNLSFNIDKHMENIVQYQNELIKNIKN